MPQTPTHRLVSKVLAETLKWDGGLYMASLGQALSQAAPNFESLQFQTSFRKRAVCRDWFASLLASNTYMEGYSAGRLKQYAEVVSNPGLKRDLNRHAEDEARHSAEFSNLIFVIFPHLDSATLRDEVRENVVDLDAVASCPADYPIPGDEETLNSLILMNLFEIKALYLGSYLKPFAVAHSPPEHGPAVHTAVSRIERDECYHIAYTARHIDRVLSVGGYGDVARTMAGFIDLMNMSDDYSL